MLTDKEIEEIDNRALEPSYFKQKEELRKTIKNPDYKPISFKEWKKVRIAIREKGQSRKSSTGVN